MSTSDEEFQIQKEEVKVRDDSPSALFGYTWGEWGLLIGSLLGSLLIFKSLLVTIGSVAVAYLYLRKLKQHLPEKFITKATQFYTRKHYVYRAAARDYEWRPPIVRG